MQIVIDIPKKEYDVIVNQGYIGVKDCHVSLSSVIKNGTPLYDKVSLKLRGKGYVMYDYDWLKEHIDMEAKIIKGEMICR